MDFQANSLIQIFIPDSGPTSPPTSQFISFIQSVYSICKLALFLIPMCSSSHSLLHLPPSVPPGFIRIKTFLSTIILHLFSEWQNLFMSSLHTMNFGKIIFQVHRFNRNEGEISSLPDTDWSFESGDWNGDLQVSSHLLSTEEKLFLISFITEEIEEYSTFHPQW